MPQKRRAPPKAISFDLDGTLLDGSPWRDVIRSTCDQIAATLPGLDATRLFEANANVWERYFPQVEDDWVLGTLDGNALTREAWRRTLLACGSEDEGATVFAAEIYLRNRRHALRLFDDVRPMLTALRRQCTFALVTNGASDTQRDAVEVLGLEGELSAVVISAEVGIAKPDPAIFRVAVDRLGIGREHLWHVGDNLHTDVAGSQSAGLTAVWLNRQAARRTEGNPQPDIELASLADLPPLLSADE